MDLRELAADLPGGPLAAWTAAWRAGRVSLDQVVDAVTRTDAPHTVSGLPDGRRLADLLVAWRRTDAPVRAAFPVPGDVRGLPGPAAVRAAALDAGLVVVGGRLAAVPRRVEYAPSSAPPTVVWTVWSAEPAPPDDVQIADVQYELTTAIRETASALAASSRVGAGGDDVPAALAVARRAGERLNLPPGFPGPAVALLGQAERMRHALRLAGPEPGLEPLVAAVRRARVAGYNAETYDFGAPRSSD